MWQMLKQTSAGTRAAVVNALQLRAAHNPSVGAVRLDASASSTDLAVDASPLHAAERISWLGLPLDTATSAVRPGDGLPVADDSADYNSHDSTVHALRPDTVDGGAKQLDLAVWPPPEAPSLSVYTSRRLLACADAPDADSRIMKISAGRYNSCNMVRNKGYCTHALAKVLCAATCQLCGSTASPALRLQAAVSRTIFGFALKHRVLHGFRPTDVYIRRNQKFNSQFTWQGLDTQY